MQVSRRIRRDEVGNVTGLFIQSYYDLLLILLWFDFVIME